MYVLYIANAHVKQLYKYICMYIYNYKRTQTYWQTPTLREVHHVKQGQQHHVRRTSTYR